MTSQKIFAGAAMLSLLCALVPVDSARAYTGLNPNALRRMSHRNFRRPVGDAERYRRNKRSLERRTIDQYTAPVDGQSTFHRREDYLRDAYQKRFDADLKSREYSGQSRSDPLRDQSRESRSYDSTLRRIRRAERGGLRLRATSTKESSNTLSDIEKRAKAAEYRARRQEHQATIYNTQELDCNTYTGRRQARCLYRKQKEE